MDLQSLWTITTVVYFVLFLKKKCLFKKKKEKKKKVLNKHQNTTWDMFWEERSWEAFILIMK